MLARLITCLDEQPRARWPMEALGRSPCPPRSCARTSTRLSEHEAPNRIEAARAARRFPAVLDLLEEEAVNLTAVRLLAPHLTLANHREVLESARGKGR